MVVYSPRINVQFIDLKSDLFIVRLIKIEANSRVGAFIKEAEGVYSDFTYFPNFSFGADKSPIFGIL